MSRRSPLVSPTTSSRLLDRSRVLDTLINNLEGMAYRCLLNSTWDMIFVSDGVRDLCGYTPAQLLDGNVTNWEQITYAEDRYEVRRKIKDSIAANQRFSIRYRIVTAQGSVRWVHERGIGVADEQGEIVVEGFIEDITQGRATLEALEQAELRYRHIFENASEGIFQTSVDGHYLAANPALARIYGYATADELVADLSDIEHRLYVDPHRREQFQRLMRQHGAVIDFESEVYRRDGSRIWISENAHLVCSAQGEVMCYEGTVRNVSERRHYQQQLQRQANHDMLTGLPNRILLGDRLEQGILRAQRLGYFLTLVFIDLDNFKFINDSLGHASGDALLKVIAERLQSCLRSSDTVARLGGDEFVILLSDHYRISTVVTVLRKLLLEIGLPVSLNNKDYQVGASLGVALYPNDGADAETLLKHADVAMYEAKQRGRNTFEFFTPELNRLAEQRLQLEAAMRVALEEGAFRVHYQPKVNRFQRIVGLEALARWHDPQMGAITPDQFIPIAEETGLIGPLTLQIMREAFIAARQWNAQRREPLRIAVNLSARLFVNLDIVAQITALLAQVGLPAEQVELEITETVFLEDSERAVTILRQLKDLGVWLAMDDFGTGYSSLSYLRQYPIDILKIDRSLVTGLEQEEDVAMIAHAAVALGRSLRKIVVAEGVELMEQFEFLREEGCNEFQGYLFSRPLPAHELSEMLEREAELFATT